MKLITSLPSLLLGASTVNAQSRCVLSDALNILSNKNVEIIKETNQAVTVSCPFGNDLLLNGAVQGSPVESKCEQNSWSNTDVECRPHKNQCPYKGIRIFSIFGKNSFKEQPTVSASDKLKMFKFKLPIAQISKKASDRGITPNELSQHGWTIVFRLNKPVDAVVSSGSFGHVSTSFSGQLFSISSNENNRELLGGNSRSPFIYLSFKKSSGSDAANARFDFDIKKISFYVGEFASTQCLDRESKKVNSFGVIRDGNLVKWLDNEKRLDMDRTDILKSAEFMSWWSGYQNGLEDGDQKDDQKDEEDQKPEEEEKEEPSFDPIDYNHVNDKAQVWTEQGFLQGTVRDNVMTFNGIPYAEAPIGQLRWMKPFTKAPWQGFFDATKSIDQVTGCLNMIDKNNPDAKTTTQSDNTSEDCLFLNMVVPKVDSLEKAGKRPVLIHVHGAGFQYLTGSNNLFNGNKLANEEGAIVITLNYRLGVFGFLGLTPAGEYAPGNQALWDVIKALEWIKMNIHHFYGDPDNITLMGESSGAHMVSTLVAMKPNSDRANLFNRAILLSTPWMISARNRGSNQGDADQVTGQLMHFLGCGQDFACAKSKSSKEILLAAAEVNGATIEGVNADGSYIIKISSTISSWTELIDGDLLDMQTFEAFQQNRILDIDLITGVTSGEGTTFLIAIAHQLLGQWIEVEQMYQGIVHTAFKDKTMNLLGAYPYPCVSGNPLGSACNSQMLLGQMIGDYMFTCPNFHLGDKLSNQNSGSNNRKSNSFLFLFDNPVPQLTTQDAWAVTPCTYTSCHGAELPYIFGSFQHDKYNRDEDRPAYTDTEEKDWELSAKMRKYWGNFLWSGNPNDSSRPSALASELEAKNQNGANGIAGSCWNDVTGKVCNDSSSSGKNFVQHFTTGTDPHLEKGVDHFRAICSVWEDLDSWMLY